MSLAIGAICERPLLNACGNVEKRKILCLSGAADHAVIDGMALARFRQRLVQLLEQGAGLDDRMIAETRRLLDCKANCA